MVLALAMGAPALGAYTTSAAAAHACDGSSRSAISRVSRPRCIAPALDAKAEGKFSKAARDRSRYASFAFAPDSVANLDVGFSYEELQASVGEIKTYTRGDMVTGTVSSFEPNGAVVDIGVKSSAYCGLSEMALVKPGAAAPDRRPAGPRPE